MNTKELSTLLIKIAGIVIIIFTVTGIPGYVASYAAFMDKSTVSYFAYVIIPNVLPLIVGIWMFLTPQKLTEKIIEIKQTDEQYKKTTNLAEIERIAITVLGIYLLFLAISDMVYNFYEWYHFKEKYKPLSGKITYIELYARITATFAELILGLWLTLGTKGIIKLLNKFRTIENK